MNTSSSSILEVEIAIGRPNIINPDTTLNMSPNMDVGVPWAYWILFGVLSARPSWSKFCKIFQMRARHFSVDSSITVSRRFMYLEVHLLNGRRRRQIAINDALTILLQGNRKCGNTFLFNKIRPKSHVLQVWLICCESLWAICENKTYFAFSFFSEFLPKN